MKLYLSSYQIGNSPQELVKLLGPKKHVALIRNAADVYKNSDRPKFLTKFMQDFAALGMTSEDLDLREYFGKSEKLESDLKRFGLLWVSGGNTFTLRRAMSASGLDQILPRILGENDLVYGGFSAGACVASYTLKWIHLADEPEKVAAGYSSTVIWEGLGLIDFYIVPHFRSSHPESEMMENVVEYLKQNNMNYRTLSDGEAVIIDGKTIRVVG